MKTLKLYGSKDLKRGIDREHSVAEIAVIDGKVCVGSAPEGAKRDLKAALVKLIASNELILRKAMVRTTKHGDADALFGMPQTPDDVTFLEALKDYHAFWDNIFGGYEINPLVSVVIEE